MDEALIFNYICQRIESGDLSESEYEELTRIADYIIKQWLHYEVLYGWFAKEVFYTINC